MSETTNIVIYDPHTWYGERELALEIDGSQFNFRVMEIGEYPDEYDYCLISDEYAQTLLPFFFSRKGRIALLKESPRYTEKLDCKKLENRFELVLTHNKSIIDRCKNSERVDFSSNWVSRDPNYGDKEKDRLVSFIGDVSRSKTKGYRFRKEVSEYLKNSNKVDLYGKGINPVEYKTEALESYHYSIVMENEYSDYYYSEKIIDCFLTKTIPIYYGCPSIGDIFDEKSIFSFQTIEELESILDKISESLYLEKYLSVKTNQEICFEYKLDSFEGYLYRVASAIKEIPRAGKLPIGGHSKTAAAIRFSFEAIFGSLVKTK